MSWLCDGQPDTVSDCPTGIDMVLVPRTGDIGNFEVYRALPSRKRRLVGPFIFWDQMGPGDFASGRGVDVRPHPHIGLSTVTYLFDGTLDHKDSLGNDLRIAPGDVNLMTAGRGIVHSERTGLDVRTQASSLYGIQSWLAQPRAYEEGDPAFLHADQQDLPLFDADGLSGRLILGELYGLKSPVATQWETLYADMTLERGTRIEIPGSIEECALYPVEGRIEVAGGSHPPRRMIVLRPGCTVTVTAVDDVRMMLLGGAAMDGPRYIWWNFVSSSLDRIKQAAEDWRARRFPVVPGDEREFIPLVHQPFPKA